MSTRVKQTLAVMAGVVIAIVMMLLGLWQMGSYEASTRDTSAERAAQPPTPLADAVSSDGVVQDVYGMRVTFRGQYLPEYQVSVGGESLWRVATAFRLVDGRYITVVRGALPSTDIERGVPAPPTGVLDAEGIFLAPDLPGPGGVATGADLATLRIQELAQEWPSPLIAGYVTLPAQESAAQGLDEASLVLPAMEGSPTHRGYALQWWVFAAGAIAFGVYTAAQIARDDRKRQVGAT